MARKNIQDDGSYQKSQKLGNSKGRFDNKELEPPIKVNIGVYDKENTNDKIERYRGDVEDEGTTRQKFQKFKLGYTPLDAEGKPVFGMVPFEGEAADMLSIENKKSAINRKIEELKSKDPTDEQLNSLERKIIERQNKGKGRFDEDLYLNDVIDKYRQRKNLIREESKKLEDKKRDKK